MRVRRSRIPFLIVVLALAASAAWFQAYAGVLTTVAAVPAPAPAGP